MGINSFSKTKKFIIGIVLSAIAVITVVYVADIGGNSVCGEWILSGEYIPSKMGFDSPLASADDLVGEKIKICKNDNEWICEWDEEIYYPKNAEIEMLDKFDFMKQNGISARAAVKDIAFPVKEVSFVNEKLEMTAVNLAIDSDGKIFVRFNDLIGDLAIFPLEK